MTDGPGPVERRWINQLRFRVFGHWPRSVVDERLREVGGGLMDVVSLNVLREIALQLEDDEATGAQKLGRIGDIVGGALLSPTTGEEGPNVVLHNYWADLSVVAQRAPEVVERELGAYIMGTGIPLPRRSGKRPAMVVTWFRKRDETYGTHMALLNEEGNVLLSWGHYDIPTLEAALEDMRFRAGSETQR